MTLLKKALCILLSLLMLLSVAACDFSSGQDAGEGSDNDESMIDTGSETDPPPEAKTSPYELIIPEGASESMRVAAVRLQSVILEKTGYYLEVKTDFISWADTPNEYEILIGEVAREEIKTEPDIKINDFVVRTVDKKWLLLGGSETATLAAIAYFTDECISSVFDAPENFRYYREGTYVVESFTLCGKDISEYIMVYPNNAPICLKYAEQIQEKIAILCGLKVPIYPEASAPKNTPRINFGGTTTSGCDLTTVGYDSYEVAASEGSVSVIGGCSYGYNNALKIVEKELKSQKILNINADALNYEFDQVSRAEYIANADLFVPIWKKSLNLSNTRTFEQKIAVFSDANTNELFTMAHRGEHDYYPECSVESVISAYLMGADAIELDVRYTADGVPVIMHDATLTRMTNYTEMKGKTVNGINLPTSDAVSDWTYEQLMQLNLKNGSVVTEFKIASLEDMLKVSKDKIFLYIDNKQADENILNVAYELMKKTGNYRSLLLGGTGTGLTKELCVELQQKIKNETGQTALIYVRANNSAANRTVSYLKENAVGPYAILLNGGYVREDKIGIKTVMENHADALNFGTWTLEGGEIEAGPTLWQEIYDLGFRFLFVDKLVDLLKYKKQNNY